jgi:hypothetical protein
MKKVKDVVDGLEKYKEITLDNGAPYIFAGENSYTLDETIDALRDENNPLYHIVSVGLSKLQSWRK